MLVLAMSDGSIRIMSGDTRIQEYAARITDNYAPAPIIPHRLRAAGKANSSAAACRLRAVRQAMEWFERRAYGRRATTMQFFTETLSDDDANKLEPRDMGQIPGINSNFGFRFWILDFGRHGWTWAIRFARNIPITAVAAFRFNVLMLSFAQ